MQRGQATLKKQLNLHVITLIIFSAGFLGLLLRPAEAFDAARQTLSLCINVIVPTLFPFFVFSSLLISLGFAEYAGKVAEPVMRPLFRVPGVCASAFVLGLLSGFPVGAKTAIDIYRKGLCTKTEAERMLSFCNNAGPAFILGTVGIGIWNSSSLGWLFWGAQIAASVLTGILMTRFWKGEELLPGERGKSRQKIISLPAAFSEAVRGSMLNVIYIAGFILFFSIVIRLLDVYGIIPAAAEFLTRMFHSSGLPEEWFTSVLSGILEMTSGIHGFGNLPADLRNLTVCGAILGWAGLSVHCQVVTFICEGGLSVRPYIYGKFLQTGFSAVFTWLFARTLPSDELSAFAGFTSYMIVDGRLSLRVFFLSSAIFLFLFSISVFIYKTISRKPKRFSKHIRKG